MNAKSALILAVHIVAGLTLVFCVFAQNMCGFGRNPVNPEPIDIVDLPPDTIHVHHWHTDTIEKERIIPRIDTVFVAMPDSTIQIGYIASMDTTHIIPVGEIRTKINFYHPQQMFDFYQTAKVRADTIYVNRTRILTQTKTKHKWEYTALGALAGVLAGFTAGALLVR